MADQELKLFGKWYSPFVRRVELALKLKGIPYDYVEEDLSNKSPLLLKYNPVHQKVPVLLHNGKPIAESLVILEYIDETWKHNLILPQNPYSKAMARFWAKFIDDTILPTAWKVMSAKEGEQGQVIEEFLQQLKLLEGELKGKEFFGGDSIGYLDITAFLIAYWFGVNQETVGLNLLTEDKFPFLHKWIGKFLDIEVVKECQPPRDKLLALFKARMAAAKSASNYGKN